MAKAKAETRGITPQSEDFSAWYNELVIRAEIVDRGPVRGTMVIRPYGYRIWELLQAELDARIKATGHENAYFPLLIPESYLHREAEHVEGFAPELAVVTHAGGRDLDEPLVVRPTSETVIGEAFARWINSYRDLPLLINQWANVVRWELRPRLLLRTTEFLWQEGHTAHASEHDALDEVMVALGFYEEIVGDVAAMAYIAGDKTEGERFAGALRTISIEAIMRDGRALQSGTSHYLGQNFARAFDIAFSNRDGILEHCYTASWGMSTRMIGGIIMAHGDDKGMILPPKLAPHQVVIVPIGRGEEFAAVLSEAEHLATSLAKAGLRVHLDGRDQLSPGFKFNEWELKGVPLRVEIGPRDVQSGSIVLANRLHATKQTLPLASAPEHIVDELDRFELDLRARSAGFLTENTVTVDTFDELAQAVSSGFALAFHCGRAECEADIQARTGATARCIPIGRGDNTNTINGSGGGGPCAVCGRPDAYGRPIVFARAY